MKDRKMRDFVAKELCSRRFHQRIVKNKKIYNRKEENKIIY